jgi:hypothetical protein
MTSSSNLLENTYDKAPPLLIVQKGLKKNLAKSLNLKNTTSLTTPSISSNNSFMAMKGYHHSHQRKVTKKPKRVREAHVLLLSKAR